MRSRKPKLDQLTFDRKQWGGTRPGAGRKKQPGSGVPHTKRAEITTPTPVHVTQKLWPGLPNLRTAAVRKVLRQAFALGREKEGFRLVHYSIQRDHLHLVVEARDRHALGKGMRALSTRVARALNRTWERTGRVFADRFHSVLLTSPRQVRNALCYVLNNARRHRLALEPGAVDPFSSGDVFDGWRRSPADAARETSPSVVSRARTWLLSRGWRRHGRIDLDEIPGPGRRRSGR
jgi:REP element-mobilizing transposase RayT